MIKDLNSHTSVIINSSGGTVKFATIDQRERLEALLKIHGLHNDVHWIEPADLRMTVMQCQKNGAKTVIVGGGDGTVNTTANILTGTSTIMGVLPVGTFNHFAGDLGFSPDLEKAVEELAHGVPQTIDVGEVNGQIFVNYVSFGLHPYAVRRRDFYQKQFGLPRLASMFYALMNAFWRLPLFHSHITINGVEKSIKSPFIFIGNNRYVFETVDATRYRPLTLDAGQLSLFYTHQITRFTLIKILFQTLVMHHDNIPELEQLMLPMVTIKSSKKILKLTIDGEVISLPPPLHFRIRPKALTVLYPGAQ